MATKMAAACRFTLVDTYFIIYHPISSNFYLWITHIKVFPKIDCGFCLSNNNQDSYQNGRFLSVCICGHFNLFSYHPISSKFHIWITWPCLIMGFVLFSLQGIMQSLTVLVSAEIWVFLFTKIHKIYQTYFTTKN